MPVRALRPVDLWRLRSLSRTAADGEVTVRTWPQEEPGNAGISGTILALAGVPRPPGSSSAWVAREGRRIVGFAVCRPRAGGLAFDIQQLVVAPEAAASGVELVERCVGAAGARGARRIFLQADRTDLAYTVAQRSGLERYATDRLYGLTPGFALPQSELFRGRPSTRRDAQALFQLYSASVPAPVRSAEALTLEEWMGLARKWQSWRPHLGGRGHREYVWELGTRLIGAVDIKYGSRSQYAALLVHPSEESALEQLIRFTVAQFTPRLPAYISARDYQDALAAALERQGFRPCAESDLYVRLLAQRVRQPRLATGNVARVKLTST